MCRRSSSARLLGQVLCGCLLGLCLAGTSTAQTTPPSVKEEVINELITLEYTDPSEIEPTLRVFLSEFGRVQGIPSAKAIMVVDRPSNIVTMKKFIAQIEEMVRVRLEKEEALRQRQQRFSEPQRTDNEKQPAAGQNTPATSQPSRNPSQLGSEPSSNTLNELKALRDDSRRLLDLLEKKASQPGPERRVSSAFGSDAGKAQQSAYVIRLAYLDLEDAEQICRSIIDEGTCHHLTRDRGIVVVCTPERYEAVRKCLAELDVEPTTVTIQATLCQVKVAEFEASGIAGDNSPKPAPVLLPKRWPEGKSHEEQFELLKQKCPSLQVIARPTMVVRDGETAIMNVLTEFPVQQLTQTNQGGSIGTTTFRETGFELQFSPIVNRDKQLTVSVNSEISAVRDWTAKNDPIIERRDLKTTLRVSSGESTIVVGLGRGLPFGLRAKKAAPTDVAEDLYTETVLIVTAEVAQPRDAASQDAGGARLR